MEHYCRLGATDHSRVSDRHVWQSVVGLPCRCPRAAGSMPVIRPVSPGSDYRGALSRSFGPISAVRLRAGGGGGWMRALNTPPTTRRCRRGVNQRWFLPLVAHLITHQAVRRCRGVAAFNSTELVRRRGSICATTGARGQHKRLAVKQFRSPLLLHGCTGAVTSYHTDMCSVDMRPAVSLGHV